MAFKLSAVKQFQTAEAAAAYVADEVISACRDAIQQHGAFHWVLAGGGTPELCYRLLRDANMDWSKVHIWFGDERALPAGDKDRNETMARHALLDFVSIPPRQIHSIDFPATTEEAAVSYAKDLQGVNRFDLVMLGMGEDGHTASLFPNNPALQSEALAVPVYNSPKPPAERVTLGLTALNNHNSCLILATGAAKADILKAIAQGAELPVTLINKATWIVDLAAWPE